MRAAVLRVRRLVVTGIEGELLAVADGSQPVGPDAQGNEVRACGHSAAFAQRQIVLGGSTLVAMTFNRHGPAPVFLQDAGVVGERLLRIGRQLVTIESEEDR